MQLEKSNNLLSLVNRIKNGDESAFSVLYDQYNEALYGLSVRIVGDTEVAQDVLQDAFVTIWKKAPLYDDTKGTFFTWMLNIVRNKSIDWLRKMKREGEGKSNLQYNNTQNLANDELKTDHIGLNDLLLKLPEEHQVILEYLYYKGYTQQEVSDEFSIPLGTVKSRSRAALTLLRDSFIIGWILWILKTI
jgi:RNA polymerase sigma-70 factor, ECF subfamily